MELSKTKDSSNGTPGEQQNVLFDGGMYACMRHFIYESNWTLWETVILQNIFKLNSMRKRKDIEQENEKDEIRYIRSEWYGLRQSLHHEEKDGVPHHHHHCYSTEYWKS